MTKGEEPMLVMEFMSHGSLNDILHNETMVLEGEVLLPIIRDIAQGVRFLHAATPMITHGDLKSHNVLVDERFRAKVADFGLAKRRGATGTPYWMAPECLKGDSGNTSASDVYSFGVILCEIYSRSNPYEGESFGEVIKLIIDPAVNKRPTLPPGTPNRVRALINDCLSSDPTQRPSFEEIDLTLKRLDANDIEPGDVRQSKKLESRRTSDLLSDVFPKKVAEALRNGKKVEPESKEMVTIFFSDMVGFTEISSKLSPMQVSDLLDRLYSEFDRLSHEHDIFKVETIGDAYMAVTNLVKDQPDHVKRIAAFAIDAIRAANETLVLEDQPELGCVNIRCGFHSGPTVANVVGSRNPRYCLFGDSVNTASRMESSSLTNRIHCSDRSAALLREQADGEFAILCRGLTKVKGKGEIQTYWIEPKNASLSRLPVED